MPPRPGFRCAHKTSSRRSDRDASEHLLDRRAGPGGRCHGSAAGRRSGSGVRQHHDPHERQGWLLDPRLLCRRRRRRRRQRGGVGFRYPGRGRWDRRADLARSFDRRGVGHGLGQRGFRVEERCVHGYREFSGRRLCQLLRRCLEPGRYRQLRRSGYRVRTADFVRRNPTCRVGGLRRPRAVGLWQGRIRL